jgi:hypothetical protein
MSTKEPLFFRLDDECFKVVDERINQIRSGNMSVAAFLMLLDRDDPFVLIGNTVYALTPVEYYSTIAINTVNGAVTSMFNAVMALPNDVLATMSKEDSDYVAEVKAKASTCSVCTYKKYKDAIYVIGKRYNVPIAEDTATLDKQIKKYPATTGTILPKVTALTPGMYKMTYEQRKACVDCVEKHVSQAYILAQETFMGYPEHLSLVCAHLCEAIEESPAQANELKETLQYCLAYTKYKGAAFVPVRAILGYVDLMRVLNSKEDTPDEQRVEAPFSMELDVTEGMKKSIAVLPKGTVDLLKAECKLAMDAINSDDKKASITLYKGALACMAERVAYTCPEFANMLRNRRLFFGADPSLAKEAGYDFQDVLDALNSKDSADN